MPSPVSRALSRAAECYPLLPPAAMAAAYLTYPASYLHKSEPFFLSSPGTNVQLSGLRKFSSSFAYSLTYLLYERRCCFRHAVQWKRRRVRKQTLSQTEGTHCVLRPPADWTRKEIRSSKVPVDPGKG